MSRLSHFVSKAQMKTRGKARAQGCRCRGSPSTATVSRERLAVEDRRGRVAWLWVDRQAPLFTDLRYRAHNFPKTQIVSHLAAVEPMEP
jgi:hypothetical protein